MNSKTSKLPITFLRTEQLSQWMPITLILILATVLRFYQLDTEGLWGDEMFSIHSARNFDPTDPGSRPLYFALLKIWMLLGTSDTWLRTPAVLFGIGSIFLTYRLGRRLLGDSIGLIAALLVTFSPLFINHSQEIRHYTLSTFLCLGGTLALTNVLERPTIAAIGSWGIIRVLAILTNQLNTLLLLPEILLFGWSFRKDRRRLLALGKVLLFVGTLLLMPAIYMFGGEFTKFMTSADGGAKAGVIPGFVDIVAMFTRLTTSWMLTEYIREVQVIPNTGQSTTEWILQNLLGLNTFNLLYVLYYAFYTLVLICLLGIVLIAICKKERSEKLLLVAMSAFLPLACIILMCHIFGPVWYRRYLVFSVPYLSILLAASFMVVWNWRQKLAILVAVFYIIAISGGLVNYYTKLHRPDWKGVAQEISTNEKPGDVIVLYTFPRVRGLSLNRYYHGKTPIYTIDHAPKTQKLDKSWIEQQVDSLARIKSRLWLVAWNYNKYIKEPELIAETLIGKDFQIQTEKVFASPHTSEIGTLFLITPATTTAAKTELLPEN
ncbi:MAG: hypothetical protein F6J89_01290 [Symploca sp. SIO1C4]|uniref:Glycosyltransferase RgtA/B/C/D-like domain-containing protein n=1 Tax=Symploca sp. SIO1C4 TaxID=2607765 RepID=A0A6B3N478_9CYAN|nr:hypothetical protein [Symploca sp. SIO1C4]